MKDYVLEILMKITVVCCDDINAGWDDDLLSGLRDAVCASSISSVVTLNISHMDPIIPHMATIRV